jgi:hypothetical protein
MASTGDLSYQSTREIHQLKKMMDILNPFTPDQKERSNELGKRPMIWYRRTQHLDNYNSRELCGSDANEETIETPTEEEI